MNNGVHVWLLPYIGQTSQGRAHRPALGYIEMGLWDDKKGFPEKRSIRGLSDTLVHEMSHLFDISHRSRDQQAVGITHMIENMTERDAYKVRCWASTGSLITSGAHAKQYYEGDGTKYLPKTEPYSDGVCSSERRRRAPPRIYSAEREGSRCTRWKSNEARPISTNICDGTKNDCYEKGKALCDVTPSCYGVAYHPGGWSASHRGVKLCLSAELSTTQIDLECRYGGTTVDSTTDSSADDSTADSSVRQKR